jgi:hypothetical protein
MARTAFAVLTVLLALALHAQTSTTEPSGSAADDALLVKAGTMYYSSAKAGLAGFDCAVHPDWHATFTAPGDSRIAMLTPVEITLHTHMNGVSSIDWTVPASAANDAESTSLRDQMHSAMEQTLTGFVEFWAPFVNGSVVPANSSGMTVTHGPSTITVHAAANGTEVTEVFSNDLLLEHYDVVMSGTSVKFDPTYKATPQGLLVEHFLGYIQKADDPSAPIQELHVGIEYQTVEGFPIPRQVNMEVVGTGVINVSLDTCTVSRQ